MRILTLFLVSIFLFPLISANADETPNQQRRRLGTFESQPLSGEKNDTVVNPETGKKLTDQSRDPQLRGKQIELLQTAEDFAKSVQARLTESIAFHSEMVKRVATKRSKMENSSPALDELKSQLVEHAAFMNGVASKVADYADWLTDEINNPQLSPDEFYKKHSETAQGIVANVKSMKDIERKIRATAQRL